MAEIEPTDEEKKNGWDKKSLTKYVKEREEARVLVIPPKRAVSQNHRYNPLRWRV